MTGRRPQRALLFVLPLVLLGACKAKDLAQDVYVWQRLQSPRLSEAINEAPARLQRFRVLGFELEKDQRVVVTKPAFKSYKNKKVVFVARINGYRLVKDFSFARVHRALEDVRKSGIEVVGLEIDFDSADAGLADYARLLDKARVKGLPLSITALPSWVSHEAFLELAQKVDEVVLQLHAVKQNNLFDLKHAQKTVARFSNISIPAQKSLSLPNYKIPSSGGVKKVSAQNVRSLLAKLPRDIKRIVWFRLPIGDGHTWSMPMFKNVVEGNGLTTSIEYRIKGNKPPFNLVAKNTGSIDVHPKMPRLINADASGVLENANAPLAPAEERTIAWVRGENIEIILP